ncbi:MAG TPA: TniQ family protein [Nocardioides sp.]|uniref:TniQ family protein n=1 Tax=Nocardioides sp. TaxID=35761 RepID=UPI002BBEFC8C|nr:TniQ family protein [Nocardioides sp.]HTW16164.1 TniQ family protein [Nocardioides sp.]
MPTPFEDEPLDGYLEHLAHGMRTDPMNLRRHFALPLRLALGAVAPLGAEQVLRLSLALGLGEVTLRAMTLQRFEHLGLVPQADARGYPSGSWPRGQGARFCPECLVERGARWRIGWYLMWSFACVRHHRLLLGDCPTCSQPVRTSPMGHPRGINTGLRVNAQRECVCPVEALASSTQQLTPETPDESFGPVSRAQQLLDRVLDGDITTIESLGAERPAVEWLGDVATIVRLLATRLDAQLAGPQLGQLLDAQPPLPSRNPPRHLAPEAHGESALGLGELWADALRLPNSERPAVRMQATVRSPVITGLCATVAVHILANDSVEAARERLGAFPVRGQASTGEFVSKYGTSWELATALRREATSARPGATLAVRLVATRFTITGHRRRPLNPSKVPASLWPGLLLSDASTAQAGYYACAASTAIVAIASGAGLHTAFASLGHSPRLVKQLKGELAGILDLQTARPSGTFAQLLALHDFLSTVDVPIDYARRRYTFQEPRRPSRRLAQRVSEESGLRQTERLTAFMGWHVHELLTGHDLLFTDPYLDLLAGHRRAYATVREHWRAEPPPTLLRVAERALQVNHLDEPITWSPRRTGQGSFFGPAPDMTRQLGGWDERPARGASRHLSAYDGRPLDEVITIAERPDNHSERRLRIDLARFQVVAESSTMTIASHRLGLTPSTLSESTRRLERRLGHQLFDRTPRGLQLTQPGRHLRRLLAQSSITPLIDGRAS